MKAHHRPICPPPPPPSTPPPLPPIVSGSTSRRPSLALCVYCLPAQLVPIGSALPSDRTMFALLSAGGSPSCPRAGPAATATDTKFRGCQPLPGAVQHLPVAAHNKSVKKKRITHLFHKVFIYFTFPFLTEDHSSVRKQAALPSALFRCQN